MSKVVCPASVTALRRDRERLYSFLAASVLARGLAPSPSKRGTPVSGSLSAFSSRMICRLSA